MIAAVKSARLNLQSKRSTNGSNLKEFKIITAVKSIRLNL